MKESKLPSGAILKVHLSPFSDARALYQSILKELKSVGFSAHTDMTSVIKDVFCIGLSSAEIEKCIWKCFERCTYDSGKGDMRIDKDTFEPADARGDYLPAQMEVVKENVLPFMKSLSAEYDSLLKILTNGQA